VIDEPLAAKLRAEMDGTGDRVYRNLLRECSVALAPLVEGVRQDDLHQLERTLLGLAQEYRANSKPCRKAVIEAKDHARLVSRNPKVSAEKRAEKEEMVLWMLTWLENPSIFEIWVGMRKNVLTGIQSSPL